MSRKQKATELVETIKSLMKSDTGLRKSQVKALHQFTDREEAPHRGIFNLATGVGKTRVMSMLALAHLQNNPNSQIVVGIPSMELFQQEMDAFQDYKDFQDKQRKKLKYPALSIPEHLDMGAFNQFKKDTTSQIIFTTYQSLEKLSQKMDTSKVGLLLLDEAHRVVSEKRSNAVNTFTNAIHYGMTATPWYSPERNAEKVLGEILAKVDIVDAIKETALAEFKNVLMVSNLSVDLSKVAKDNATGDYKEEDFCKVILQAMRGNSANSGNEENWKEAHHYIAKEVAKFYHDYIDEHVGALNGKKCLINCRSQEEARIQAQELNKLFGHMVARVHTSDECDSQTIQDFVDGDLPIVCQVGKLTEGFDMPNLDMTINYPTASFVREAQGAARCIRLPKVDSKISPQKMGLVVDIAFKHPKYNNIIDAIRQNKQILFQDVVGSPFVQHDDEELQLKEINKQEFKELQKKWGKTDIKRVNFTIISNAQELMRLQKEADKLADERYIPTIRKGMKTSTDFNGFSDLKVHKWLKNSYDKKEIFYLDSDTKHEHPLPLVEFIKPKMGVPCLALHESPEAMRKFEELHPELKMKKIRPGMKTTTTLCQMIGIGHKTATSLLQEAYDKKEIFYLDSDTKHENPLPLVEFIKPTTGTACLALHESPEAMRNFEELYPELKMKKIRQGMRTSKNFDNISDFLVRNWLQEAYEKAEKFYLDSDVKKEHPINLVEEVKTRAGISFSLHEAPEAMRKFEELHPELKIKKIRPGMKMANNFSIRRETVRPWLEDAYSKKEIFYLDSDREHEQPIFLIELVKSGSQTIHALHEAPEAMRKFEELHPELKIKKIRPGMRTVSSFEGSPNTIRPLLQDAFNKKETFFPTSDKEHKTPIHLIELVKSGNQTTFALHEDPEALKTFKNWVQKTYGKKIQESTTSLSLCSRLKNASISGKTKSLSPHRLTATAEI